MAFLRFSFLVIDFVIPVSVKLGAIQFTRISGESSAAKETVSASIPPLAVDIIVWLVNPCLTAIEEKNNLIVIKFSKSTINQPSNLLKKFKLNINDFFEKRKKLKVFPYKMQGTRNQKNVWREISKIKHGTTKTYMEIGDKVNLHPRIVGRICGQNKLLLIVPCHRVIKSNGSMGGFSSKGGIKLKKKLLSLEKSN